MLRPRYPWVLSLQIRQADVTPDCFVKDLFADTTHSMSSVNTPLFGTLDKATLSDQAPCGILHRPIDLPTNSYSLL